MVGDVDAGEVRTYDVAVDVAALEAAPRTDDPAGPALPYRDVTVVLPFGGSLADVRVSAEGVVGSVPVETLLPATPSILGPAGPAAPRALPASASVFPAVWGESLGTSTWHGYALAHVRLYPCRALRDGDVAAWTELETATTLRVEIATEAGAPDVARPQRRRDGERRRVESVLAERVLNPADLGVYPDFGTTVIASEKGFSPSAAPSMEGSAVDFLIVTDEAMAPVFQQLADHRVSLGTTSAVRTMEWIEANSLTAMDPAMLLREFLRDAYERWGVRWVLLGGDVDVVPTRMIYNSYYPTGTGTDLPVDLYFAGLDGNWNADGDEILGEPYLNPTAPGDGADLVPELHLGRAPVSTPAQAQVFVDKIKTYELTGAGAHNGRALFMSEVLTPSSYTPGDLIEDDGATYSEQVVDGVLAATAVQYDRYYEAWTLWPGSQEETKSAVLSAMDSGDYGIVNHVGHGFFYTMSVGDGTLGVNDAESLSNGPAYFFLNNLNCASAAFDYNSITERFVTDDDGGAVAAFGASRAAFPATAGAYQLSFYEQLFTHGYDRVGETMDRCRTPFDAATDINSVERWTHMSLVLIGDPCLRVYTGVPGTLEVTAPTEIVQGLNTVHVVVREQGVPLSGATVTLWKDGDDYVAGVTDASGAVDLEFSAKEAGSVTVGAEHAGFVPHLGTIDVLTSADAYYRLDAYEIIDDGSFGTDGNGNGLIDAGETVGVATTWRNTGAGAAAASGILLASCSEPGVSLIVDAVGLPAAGSGATVDADAPLLLAIDTSVSDRTEFLLEFGAVVDGETCLDETVLEVLAPEIAVSIMSWNDFPVGDGDGKMESGENILVWFSILNSGWGEARNVTGWVEEGDPNLTVVQGAASWPDVPRFGEVAQLDSLIVMMNVVGDDRLAYLHITDDRGHEWVHAFSLTRPDKPVVQTAYAPAGGEALMLWDPNEEDDLFGYHVWRALAPAGPFTRLTDLPMEGASFFHDTGLDAMTTYFYRMAAVDTSRILSRYSSILPVSTMPVMQAGYPAPMAAETSGHLAMGDVNGDGVNEVVTASDAVYVFTADGGELRDGDGDPATLGPFDGLGLNWSLGGLALGNITAAPGMEIVASCRSNHSVYVFQGDGSIAPGWPQTMERWNWATPTVGDLDGDGDLEIVVNNVTGRLYVWHHDGTEFLDGDGDPGTHGLFHQRTDEWYSTSSPALADLDGDGTLEIVLGTKMNYPHVDQLHVLRNDGGEAPGFPYDLGTAGDMTCSPAVTDLDDDGVLEIVFVTESDLLHVVDENGSARGGFPVPLICNSNATNSTCPSPAFGDFDQDGRLDIVAVAISDLLVGEVVVYDADGVMLPGWPFTTQGSSQSSPVVADINGDGFLDVVFGIGGGTDSQPNLIYGIRHNGTAVPGFPLTMDGPVWSTPAVGDFDGDGDLELMYAGWDLDMKVWDLPAAWDPALAPWPAFQGNPLHTGMLPQNWITAVEDDAPPTPLALELSENVPNPFNPSTRIEFALPIEAAGPVTLQVLDLRGRVVATLVDETLGAGRHAAVWRGCDARGRPQASGVYLYRLDTEAGRMSGRMVLVR